MDFTNKAILEYNGKKVNSNLVRGSMLAPLTMIKSSRTPSYSPQSDIYYTITITNTSNIAYDNMILTDDLGRYEWNGFTRFLLEYIPDSCELLIIDSNGITTRKMSGVIDDSGINFTLNIPPNSALIASYITRPTQFTYYDKGQSIINNAQLHIFPGGTLFDTISTSYEIPVADFTDVHINKNLNDPSVEIGKPLTYTFTVSNYGNTEASPAISDLLNPFLTDIQVYGNGTLWTENVEYTYEKPTGFLTIKENSFTLEPAQFKTGHLSARQTFPSSYEIRVTGTVYSLTAPDIYINIIPCYSDGREKEIEITQSAFRQFVIKSEPNFPVKCQVISNFDCRYSLLNSPASGITIGNDILTFDTSYHSLSDTINATYTDANGQTKKTSVRIKYELK